MTILELIRNNTISSNWFMMKNDWYCFSNGELYTQDKTKQGSDSIVEVKDTDIYKKVLHYYEGL